MKLVRDLRNIIDAKTANGDAAIVSEVLSAFATILSDFAEAELDDDNEDDSDRLDDAAELLNQLSIRFRS